MSKIVDYPMFMNLSGPLFAALLLAPSPAMVAPQQSTEKPEDAARKAKAQSLITQAFAAQKAGDTPKMFKLLEEAIGMFRNPEAMHRLGHMYESTPSMAGAASKALRWYAAAGEEGHGESISHLVKALQASAQLSDDDFSIAATALTKGMRHSFSHEGQATADAIFKKQIAATKCATDLAARLGYVSDATTDQFSRNKNHWYAVRSGSGAGSRGDQLTIYGTEEDQGSFGMYSVSRLRVRASGFTGIKFGSIALSEGRSFPTKDYTGYTERGSAQAQSDSQAILKACKVL